MRMWHLNQLQTSCSLRNYYIEFHYFYLRSLYPCLFGIAMSACYSHSGLSYGCRCITLVIDTEIYEPVAVRGTEVRIQVWVVSVSAPNVTSISPTPAVSLKLYIISENESCGAVCVCACACV